MPHNENQAPFLKDGIPPPKYSGKVVQFPVQKTSSSSGSTHEQDHLEDVSKLLPGELRNKYALTYSAWRNMKQRAKAGAIIHQDFADFRSFLRHVGPRLHPNYSLDRLDNADPEYAPKKVMWRDKFAQNSNKGNNVILTDDSGEHHTVAQWAVITKTLSTTIHKRIANGWSEHEAIHGKTNPTTKLNNLSWGHTPWPVGSEPQLEDAWALEQANGHNDRSRESFLLEVANDQMATAEASYNSAKGQSIDAEMGVENALISAADAAIARGRFLQAERILGRAKRVLASAREHAAYRVRLESSRFGGRVVLRAFLKTVPRPPRLPVNSA